MKHYIGIDLGTTNSAVSSFDGETVRLYKSPEQNDVTPSAIYIDKRGNKHVGKRAYDNAARNPDNAATLFKRLMGTSTKIKLAALEEPVTPEFCSAEILKVLFGYLPEEIRNSPDTGTVITVPAAFNQMQKDATMAAAESAGLGRVALMQEPVAAVMSVMRHQKTDGVFVVYDLGGGTLDIAIAESTGGRVSLLSHGGIAMCGGRDFDRILVDNVVKPWLLERFDLPDDVMVSKDYASLRYMAAWAAEKAKIELSAQDEAVIGLDDSELRLKDRAGVDVYLDITLTRVAYDDLIATMIDDSIAATRLTIEKAGLSPHDIGRVVFVGGPTQYKPLRDKVAFELGIAASTDVNPMTAVCEGAAVFAESIDWASETRGRKSGRGELAVKAGLELSFAFTSRTPDSKARIIAKIAGKLIQGTAFQVDSLDTGWSSGRIQLRADAFVDVPLGKQGENTFKIFVFDAAGGRIGLASDKIVITRTAAQIDAIPASHSLGLEALQKLGGKSVMDYLVREGDALPKKGQKTMKAGETLLAGGSNSINFKLWEGSIEDPVTDNRFVGIFQIRGSDFVDGVIARGADMILDYEISDSGNIKLDVTVPSIGGNFRGGRNFYVRAGAEIDFRDASKLIETDVEQVRSRVDEISGVVDDARLSAARERLDSASASPGTTDPETAKKAMDDVQEAKRLLALARKDHLSTIRRIELDDVVAFFEKQIRKHATDAEQRSFDNLARTATKAATVVKTADFDAHLRELRAINWRVLYRQDWFVIDRFRYLADATWQFPDAPHHQRLVAAGQKAVADNQIPALRDIVDELESVRSGPPRGEQMLESSNILMT